MLYRKTVPLFIIMQIHIHVVSKMQILMYQHVVQGVSMWYRVILSLEAPNYCL